MSAEDDINQLLTRYVRAIHDKDAAAVAGCYSKDVVAYDLAPPLALESRAAVTDPAVLDQWFGTVQSIQQLRTCTSVPATTSAMPLPSGT